MFRTDVISRDIEMFIDTCIIAPFSFGIRHTARTGLSALIATIGAAILHAPLGPAAAVAATSTFILSPVKIIVSDREGKSLDTATSRAIYIALNILTSGLMFGGAVMLGIVSLPVAGVIFGAYALSDLTDGITSIVGRGTKSRMIIASFMGCTAQIAIIAAATFGLISLGAVTAPLGIGIGVTLGVLFCANSFFEASDALKSNLSYYKTQFDLWDK